MRLPRPQPIGKRVQEIIMLKSTGQEEGVKVENDSRVCEKEGGRCHRSESHRVVGDNRGNLDIFIREVY